MEKYYDEVIENVHDMDEVNVATGHKNVEKGDIAKVENIWSQTKTQFKTWNTNYATEAALPGGLSG